MIQDKRFSKRLLMSSRLTIISIYTAYLYRIWSSCILGILVLCTSHAYWSNPVRGVRRNLDITVVTIAVTYQMFYASQSLDMIKRTVYYAWVFVMIMCYAAARYQGRYRHNHHLASVYHMLLHLTGTCGNIYLYTAEPIPHLPYTNMTKHA